MQLLALLVALLLPAIVGLAVAVLVARRQPSLRAALLYGVAIGLVVQIALVVVGYIIPYGQFVYWMASLLPWSSQ